MYVDAELQMAIFNNTSISWAIINIKEIVDDAY